MKHTVCLIMAFSFVLSGGGNAYPQTFIASTIVLEQPWARATAGVAKTGAAYMTVTNKGASADRQLSAATPLADKMQFYKETEENGVAHMREVHSVDLEPGAPTSSSRAGCT